MRKVLAANEDLVVAATGNHINMAVITGDITYKIGDNTIPDADANVLNEDIRTDRIFTANLPNKNIYVKAGTYGATIQYRLE